MSIARLRPLGLVEAPEKIDELLRHRLGLDRLVKCSQPGGYYAIGIIFPGASSRYASRAPVGPIVHFSIPRTEGSNPPAVFHSYVVVGKLFPEFARRAHDIDVSCVTPPPISATLRTIV